MLGTGKVEQQGVRFAVRNSNGHGVRGLRIVGVQQIAFHSIPQLDNLIPATHVDVIAQAAVRPKLHAHARRKIERRIRAEEAPGAQ